MIGALFLLDTDRNITTTCLQTLEMNIMNGIYIFTMASARKEEESGLSFYILYFYCCFGSFVPTFIILSFKLVQPLKTSFPHHLNRAKFNKSLTPRCWHTWARSLYAHPQQVANPTYNQVLVDTHPLEQPSPIKVKQRIETRKTN